MASFTSWSDLARKMRDDLASGKWRTESYEFDGLPTQAYAYYAFKSSHICTSLIIFLFSIPLTLPQNAANYQPMRSYKTISPSEAAKRLGYIDSRWIQRQAKTGKIPGAYYTETGRARIPVTWVTWQKFLDSIRYNKDKGGRKRGYSPKKNCVEE